MEKAIHKATRKDAVHPKQKHVDTLIQMTLSGASMEELFMLVQDRFSEANWVISFKALILVHILMHEGNGPAIYDYLIRRPNALDMHRFRDRHGTKGVSEFEQSKNVRTYAAYLNDKVLAYKAIRIDHVTQGNPNGSQIFVKQPTDIKFMLLEVSTVQKQLHSVLKNRFDTDTLDNETTFSAFRYCLRDMLKLFQVMNFGVMKMLKVYFQMPEEDMRRALDLYKRFVKLTDRTAEYLKIARQFETIFGFTIPNLNHAPLSLSRALEDFLNMPLDERKETVSAMKSAPKPVQARTNSDSARNANAGSVRMGPNGRVKPDYGLRLKPELLALSDESPPPSAKPARDHVRPKAAAIASTSTLDQPTSGGTESDAKPATKDIDFIDFFSSIDDETSVPAGPSAHMGESGAVASGTAQPAAVTDFDAMFFALSNPFAAQQQVQQVPQQQMAVPFTSMTSAPMGVSQPFNAFGEASTALVSSNAFASADAFASPSAFGSAGSNMTPFQAPQSGLSVAANNPFRQSMFPVQDDAALVSQMAQMSLQQQQLQQLQLEQQRAQLQQQQAQLQQQQLQQQAAYNPFAQRQTMYMAESTQSQTASFSTAASSAQVASGQQTDPFAHFNAAFSTNTSNVASVQQGQMGAHNLQPAGAHNLQAAMNNGNFANFDFFK
ncbi:hypothetical protein IW147_004934 [Coemansia sp. RSA 720]|nr:hypothetical protein IW147_004934 [Coemansia sp. RSA 720]